MLSKRENDNNSISIINQKVSKIIQSYFRSKLKPIKAFKSLR